MSRPLTIPNLKKNRNKKIGAFPAKKYFQYMTGQIVQ